jgi:hypothetical protein
MRHAVDLANDDYSIAPTFAGRRVEVRVSQEHVTAVVLDTGELACRHRRSFAGGLTFTIRRTRPNSTGSERAVAAGTR